MKLVASLFLVLSALVGGVAVAQEGPPVYFVLFHSPGSSWQEGTSFREQPGVREHVAYMAGFEQEGVLVMGGPFLDDSGGMMVMQAESLEVAQTLAEADPAVQSNLLNVEVKPWMVVMRQPAD